MPPGQCPVGLLPLTPSLLCGVLAGNALGGHILSFPGKADCCFSGFTDALGARPGLVRDGLLGAGSGPPLAAPEVGTVCSSELAARGEAPHAAAIASSLTSKNSVSYITVVRA